MRSSHKSHLVQTLSSLPKLHQEKPGSTLKAEDGNQSQSCCKAVSFEDKEVEVESTFHSTDKKYWGLLEMLQFMGQGVFVLPLQHHCSEV